MLNAERLTCSRGARTLFRDLDLALAPGELVQVEGANGSGKTTLLRALCGLVPLDAGTVRWDGADIDEARIEFLAALTYVGHAPAVKQDLTGRENLRAISALAGVPRATTIDEALAHLELRDLADTALRALSAGQRRRVGLARLLLHPTVLWVLDEPFTALDVAGKRILERLVRDHCRRGGMALVTTHQPADFGDLPVRTIHLGSP